MPNFMVDEGQHVNTTDSADLTPMDFFFWGFMKDIIYRENVQCVADL
jgi:hypothetical protein